MIWENPPHWARSTSTRRAWCAWLRRSIGVRPTVRGLFPGRVDRRSLGVGGLGAEGLGLRVECRLIAEGRGGRNRRVQG